MLRGYGTAREYLADIVALADAMFRWHATSATAHDDSALREAGERAVELACLEDTMAARLAATRPALPLQLACEQFALSATETRVLALLVAFEVAPQADRERRTSSCRRTARCSSTRWQRSAPARMRPGSRPRSEPCHGSSSSRSADCASISSSRAPRR